MKREREREREDDDSRELLNSDFCEIFWNRSKHHYSLFQENIFFIITTSSFYCFLHQSIVVRVMGYIH